MADLAGPTTVQRLHTLAAATTVGMLVATVPFDVVSAVADTAWVYARGAWLLTGLGAAVGLVAAVLGLALLRELPRSSPDFRTGVRHLVLLDLALVGATASFLVRNTSEFRFHDTAPPAALALSAISVALLVAGAWIGTGLARRRPSAVDEVVPDLVEDGGADDRRPELAGVDLVGEDRVGRPVEGPAEIDDA